MTSILFFSRYAIFQKQIKADPVLHSQPTTKRSVAVSFLITNLTHIHYPGYAVQNSYYITILPLFLSYSVLFPFRYLLYIHIDKSYFFNNQRIPYAGIYISFAIISLFKSKSL